LPDNFKTVVGRFCFGRQESWAIFDDKLTNFSPLILSTKRSTYQSAALPISAQSAEKKIEHVLLAREKSPDRIVGFGMTGYRQKSADKKIVNCVTGFSRKKSLISSFDRAIELQSRRRCISSFIR